MDQLVNEQKWQTKATTDVLLERALMLKNIRAFFDARNVIEVETPLLSHYATTDPHLDSFQSGFRGQRCYLNTSPEYAMKRLLASWQRPIYQICKAFRDDELGPNHNPEFTMLEWYRPGFSLSQLMDEMCDLVMNICQLSPCFAEKKLLVDGVLPDKSGFIRLSYQQAFEDYVGINPHQATSEQCYQLLQTKNIEIPQGLTVDDAVDAWLDWILMRLVMPALSKSSLSKSGLSKNSFIFLYDYPASQCALAKIETSQQQFSVAKRFELFFGEIELANGFYELTDAQKQLQRFQQENMMRTAAGKMPGVIDKNFIAALESGLPDCSGVALGLDRLLMVLAGIPDIDEVLAFSWRYA